MKAVVLTAPEGAQNLQLVETATPYPAPDEVRIQVRAAGFNPADYKMRKTLPSESFPFILGGEVSGVIDAVGADVVEFRIDDAVCAYLPVKRGGYAEAVCTHAAFVALKPENISFSQAAAIPLAGLTALVCVGNGMIGPKSSLFIAGGAGGVGSFAVELGRAAGASPIVTTAGSDASVTYLTQTLGIPASKILRYDQTPDHELASHARALNAGNSYQVALDLVGQRMTRLCCEIVDFNGRAMSIVRWAEDEEVEHLQNRSASFRFVRLQARARSGDSSTWREYQKHLTELLSLVSRGTIRMPKVEEIGTLSAEAVRVAHQRLENGHVQGKIVMTVP